MNGNITEEMKEHFRASFLFAGLGRETLSAFAHTSLFLTLAGGLSEVGGGTADVMDISLEIGEFGQHFRFLDDGFFASGGDGTSLMVCDRAEIARPIATSNVVDGEFDFFYGRDTAERFVRRMISSFVRKLIDMVKFFGFKRKRGRVLYDDLFAVALNDCFTADGVVLVLLDTARARICEISFRRLCLDLVKRRTFHRGGNIGIFICGDCISGSENIVHHGDRFSVLQTVSNFRDLVFAHAEHQKIGVGIH